MASKNIEDFYPLAPLQQGMLFHSLLAPESGVYIGQLRCTLTGDLDVAAFRRAWERVVERHATLRTAFVVGELKEPVQVVHRQVALPLDLHDWQGLAPPEQDARLQDYLAEDARRGFALDTAPLLRLALFRTGLDEHRLVWTYHHILFDGWSLPLILREVFASYAAFRAGRIPVLPPPRPYRAYIAWLRRQDPAAAEAFWRRELAGFRTPTPLAVARQPVGESEHAERDMRLDADLTRALDGLARRRGVTLNTVVQGAWALLLSRYSGDDDVVFGATVSGRPAELPGADEIVGLFINTLPVRVAVPDDAPAIEWLRALQAHQAELRQFEYTPLVQIQGWSELPPNTPLFQSILVFENFPIAAALREDPANEPALRVTAVDDRQRTNFPLALIAYPGEELTLRLAYDRARFDDATIGRMLGHLRTILAAVVADPERPLGSVPLLTDAERRRTLIEWNDTARAFPPGLAHDLIAERAARTPEATALRYEGAELSYRDLNARANQLARHLRQLDVGPDVLVGIHAAPAPELVIAVLAVLKAGGAYLPLDPAYPPERLRFMLEDAVPRVVLTDGGRGAGAGGQTILPAGRWALLDLAADRPAIARQPATDLPPAATPDSLAYCIYTSGSTGQPKGTLIEHRGLANLVHVVNEEFAITPESRVLQFASFNFDAAVSEILPPLAAGATLVLAPRARLADPEALLRLLREEAISVVTLPPSLLAVLPDDDLPALRTVVSAGERCAWEIAGRWGRGRRFLNGYGPTETTVAASYYHAGAPVPDARSVPIGRPIANVTMLVLDRRGEPAPVGVPGELYIGGVGVARGYLHHPELTAEKFLEAGGLRREAGDARHAPSPQPSAARLYRTGDRCRYLPDGTIEFLGRGDEQIKLRGYRIEPGEIAAVLRQHPAVADAAVVLREDTPGVERLVAYVVPGAKGQGTGGRGAGDAERGSGGAGERGDGGRQTMDEERAAHRAPNVQRSTLGAALVTWLRERLPAWMVPSAVVTLEALPLTPNGKVDKRALPPPEGDGAGDTCAAPRTPTEELLAGLWATLLGVDGVGPDDDFFALGGHSLLATQLASRIRETLRAAVPLRRLFEAPTLAAMARAVEQARDAADGPAPPPLTPAPRDGDLPLSFAQQRLWFLDQLEPGSPLYNIPAAVRLRGPLDAAALEQALAEVVRRHEVLRTAIITEGGRPRQMIATAATAALPLTDLSGLPETEREAAVARLAAADARAPFDLGAPPLLRARLLRLQADEHVVLFTMHHIVSDGWSMGVLVRELGGAYAAYAAGRSPELPPLPIQYADYAAWQRAWLQGEALERQLAFWRERLAGAPPLLELPTDRPRPGVQSYAGATRVFPIPPDLAGQARRCGRTHGATLFMTLLAAFQALLYRYTEQEDICVGTPVAGRTRPETEPLIGFFVNTLVVRADLSGDPSFAALLRQTRERALEAYAHQDVPFEMVVDALQPERSMSYTPLFQVLFALQSAPGRAGGPAAPGGLEVSAVETHSGTAKFDLTVEILDGPNGLAASFEWSTALFDAATIERMAGQYIRLLAAAVTAPETPISRLPLLDEAERRQLLAAWSHAIPAPDAPPVHDRFAAQAQRTPDAIAVTCAGQHLTYAALNARANQLARLLRARGAGPDTLVALRLPRTLDLVVAILAVLKAGAAYLPIEPATPPARQRFMLDDAQPVVLLTTDDGPPQTDDRGQWDDRGRWAVIDLQAEAAVIARQPATDPPPLATPAHLAYCIYTSGSTGQPKGCLITHANLARLFSATDAWFGFGPHDVWTLFHSAAFDFSVWELWGALLYGGRLVVVPWAVSRDPAAFLELLASEQVTVLNQTPSAFLQLLPHALAAEAPSLALRYVIFGGEALDVAALRPWFDRHGDMRPRLVNMYGITETTVHVTYRPLTAADVAAAGGGRASPIGQRIPDLTLYVLDRHLEPVPAGVPGELYVGGAGVARGYLNRPELTAERFVEAGGVRREAGDAPHVPSVQPPAASRQPPAARLYRTGDRARWRADGELEYLGRLDGQVKLRGFRIELGEVEATLRAHPDVAAAAVVVRADRPGDKRLVAYVVPGAASQEPQAKSSKDQDRERGSQGAGERADDARRTMDGDDAAFIAHRSSLLAWLRARLPDYMVPAAIVTLDALPLTANGKLDRNALPPPSGERWGMSAAYAPPETDAERTLAAIWAQVLGVPQVGRYDNFFELGGDSIVSIQVVALAAQAGLRIAPRHFFQEGTLAGLAALAEPAGAAPAAVPHGEAPLTPIQRWFFARHPRAPEHWNTSIMLEAPAGLDPALLERAATALVAHHDALRLRFTCEDGTWRQVAAAGADTAEVFRVVDLAGVPARRRRAAIEAAAAAAQAGFDLASGPLVRIVLLDLGPRISARLLLVFHHLVIDGVSLRIVLHDLLTLYQQLARDAAPVLPPKTTPFVAWARRLPELAASPAIAGQLEYWTRLAGRQAALPVDLPGGTNTYGDAERLVVGLNARETDALLRRLPAALDARVDELLLAALALAFRAWTGEPELLLELDTHGRADVLDGVDLSRTVGWFTSIYPVLLCAPDDDPLAALRAVQEALRGVPDHGIGYGLLRELHPDPAVRERMAAVPQPAVSFNYLGQFDRGQDGATPGLPLRIAPESPGPEQHPANPRPAELYVVGVVAGGTFDVQWSYSARRYRRATIQRLADTYVRQIRALIAYG
jgi:amino acid adenylation domain-containing protein/non-ribosomal peptide synthase protein (TIGR01720 family)